MIKNLQQDLREHADAIRAEHAYRFFKTGPGEYGEGDKFLGVTVPDQRAIAKKYLNLPLNETFELLKSEWHEERLTAVFILCLKFQVSDELDQKQIYELYLQNSKCINNWDLVDSSAHKIVGPYLAGKPYKMTVLTGLAESELIWDRRIAMISTLYNIAKLHSETEAIEIATLLLRDKHDLIHKAVGWCLREVGKNIDVEILVNFLNQHAHEMPRTMLRYSIEKLDEPTRKYYMGLKEPV